MKPGAPRLGALVLGLTAIAGPASAHDVWLEPGSFRPRPGETVGIGVMVGEAFHGEAVPRRTARIARFWVGDGPHREPVRGVDGVSPAGLVRLADDADGWQTVLYESRPAEIVLSPERFVAHLEREGIADLVRGLESLGEGEPIHEVYSRCVATLLLVGRGTGAEPARPDTCAISIWPVVAPRAPGAIEFELLMEGRPIERALLRAYRKGDTGDRRPVEGRTDALGRVTLTLAESGPWLVKALRVEPRDERRTEWRSWWASLTLELSGD